MKKALALILCVLMMASCMVFSSSAVADGYDYRQVALEEGAPHALVKTYAQTAPVIDGVVSTGEYTTSVVMTPDNDDNLTVDLAAQKISSFTLSYAHDVRYVYMAVTIVSTQAKALNGFYPQLAVMNNTQHVSTTVFANRCDVNTLGKYNADGTRSVTATTFNGLSYTAEDIDTRAGISADKLTRVYEYKFSKEALKAITKAHPSNTSMSLDFEVNAFCVAFNGISTSDGFIWWKPSAAAGTKISAGEGTSGRSDCGMIQAFLGDYNFAENQMNDGAALFAGPKLAPENVPVIDGKISEGEYYSSKTFTSGNLPAFFGQQATFDSADVKHLTYHVAHDGENVYFAIEVEKNAAPKSKKFDRFQFQYGIANIANQESDTNFLNRDVPMITFDDANGQGAVYYSNNSIYDEATGNSSHGNVWERDFSKIKYASILEAWAGAATEDYRITVYEYKINLERLASVYTQWAGTKDNLEQVANKDFLAVAIVYSKAYTATKDWADVAGPWLWYQPSLGTKAAMDVVNDVRADNGQQPTWGMLPIFLCAENGVSTQETASVRISGVNDGLRFKTTISKFELDKLVEKYGYADVQVGTLIAPADAIEGALTHESGVAGVDYLDVKATVDAPFAETNMFYTYAGSITNIKKDNLDRDFVAVGYIAYTNAAGQTQYIYSTSASTRNVSAVATAALADVTANYTDTQKTILGNLVVAK